MTPTARPWSVTRTAVERPLERSSKAASACSCCSMVGNGGSMTSTTWASSLGLAEQPLQQGALLDGADHAGQVGRVLAVDDRELADRVGVEAVDRLLDPFVGGDGDQRRGVVVGLAAEHVDHAGRAPAGRKPWSRIQSSL